MVIKQVLKCLEVKCIKNGYWHSEVHIWVVNYNGDILLQRRSYSKESWPGMLSISSAGHVTSGETALEAAIRETNEELNLNSIESDFQLIKVLKRHSKYSISFINNEFAHMYIALTDKTISQMQFPKEEIAEILYVSYVQFKNMVNNKQEDLMLFDDEFKLLFDWIERVVLKNR